MSAPDRHLPPVVADTRLLVAAHALTAVGSWVPDSSDPGSDEEMALAVLAEVRRVQQWADRQVSAMRQTLAEQGVDAERVARALGVQESSEESWRARHAANR